MEPELVWAREGTAVHQRTADVLEELMGKPLKKAKGVTACGMIPKKASLESHGKNYSLSLRSSENPLKGVEQRRVGLL